MEYQENSVSFHCKANTSWSYRGSFPGRPGASQGPRGEGQGHDEGQAKTTDGGGDHPSDFVYGFEANEAVLEAALTFYRERERDEREREDIEADSGRKSQFTGHVKVSTFRSNVLCP